MRSSTLDVSLPRSRTTRCGPRQTTCSTVTGTPIMVVIPYEPLSSSRRVTVRNEVTSLIQSSCVAGRFGRSCQRCVVQRDSKPLPKSQSELRYFARLNLRNARFSRSWRTSVYPGRFLSGRSSCSNVPDNVAIRRVLSKCSARQALNVFDNAAPSNSSDHEVHRIYTMMIAV